MSAWYNPDDKTVYGSHESDQVVGTYLGKSVQAAGNGIAKLGESIKSVNYVWNNTAPADTTPIWINGSSKPFMYVTETSSGTSATADFTTHFRTLGDTADSTVWASGPVRTARYKDTGNLAWSDEFTLRGHNHYDTVERVGGVRWYHDDRIADDRAYMFDPDTLKNLDQKTIEKANKKSIKLLKEWLSDAEYKYLMEEGNLELPSQHEKDTIYIVNKDPMKRIGIKKHGKVVEKSLCIHANHSYPTGDVLLANIMLLKTDEKKFLEIANVHDFYV